MSFGKRGLVPTPRKALKEHFIKLSSKRLNLFTNRDLRISLGWSRKGSLGGIVYPLSCLALGIVLGGGIGATLAPQVLHAENNGIYDVIRMNDAMMRAKAARPAVVARPQVRLPQVSLRRSRGRANVMQARLTPAGSEPAHRHLHREHPLDVTKPAPEIGPKECASCEIAKYGSPLEAILHDKTLRAGDTVMMSLGAVVFRGGGQPPYTAADFTDFHKSTLLTKKERQLIDDDLGLSRRAELMRDFDAKARTARASSEVARAGGAHVSQP
jgi:hypothetical protein